MSAMDNPTSAPTMTLEEFGDFAVGMWFSNGDKPVSQERDLPIMALGLAGESGEVLEHIKKLIRDGNLDKDALRKELGDVIYYWVRICRYFDISPTEAIAANVEKLKSRRARGKLRGDGDNR